MLQETINQIMQEFSNDFLASLQSGKFTELDKSEQLLQEYSRLYKNEKYIFDKITDKKISLLLDKFKIELQKKIQPIFTEIQMKVKQKSDIDDILYSAVEGFVKLDTELNIIMANPAFCSILKKKRSEVIGSSLFDLADERDFKELVIQKALRQKNKRSSYKIRLLASNGERVLVRFNESPIFDESSTWIGSFAFISDLTTYNKMNIELEKRVRERTAQLEKSFKTTEAIMQGMPIGLFIINKNKYIIKTNKAALDIIGKEETDVIGNEVDKFLYYSQQINTEQLGNNSKQIKNTENYIISSNNQLVPVLTTAIPINLSGENVLLEAFVDITELKKSQKAMEVSEKKYREIFEKFQDLFFRIKSNGIVEVVSPSSESILGYKPEMMIGESIFEYCTDKSALKELFALLETAEEVNDKELDFINSNGEIVNMSVNMHIVYDSKSTEVIYEGILRDITYRKQTEEQIVKSMIAAEEANKAKSEFLANMSHEIRTPMNAILGFSDLLADIVTDEKQKTYLNAISSAGKSLLTIINDILDLSKIEAGRMEIKYEKINASQFFSEFKSIFQLKIKEKNLKYIEDIDEQLPNTIVLDDVRLRQIIFNLIGNAVKFTEKGYIKLEVKVPSIDIDRKVADVMVAVEDTGIGVPKKSQQLIFESFRQQDGQSTKKYGGTGLGLTISKKLVSMMNGTLSLISEENKGSRFEILFKDVAFDEEEVQIDSSSNKNVSYDFTGSKILIVDDVDANRFLINEILQKTNAILFEANNGRIAIDKTNEIKPDIILMDIRMPEMDGYEATKLLKSKEELKTIPIIALTASVMEKDTNKIISTGFDSYLKKPIDKYDLLEMINKYVGGRVEEIIQIEENEVVVEEDIDFLGLSAELEKHLEAVEEAKDSFRMADAQAVLDNLLKINETYHSSEFEKLINKLKLGIDSFDFELIENSLSLIEKFYEKINKENG